MATKFCSKFQGTKPTYEFNHDSHTADGFHYNCKQCCVEQVRQWRINNRDQANEQERNYYATNPQRRISKCVHMRLTNILKSGTYTRRTAEIIGLTQGQVLNWISYNFEGEMMWSNYGVLWEFDLIILMTLQLGCNY